MRFMRLTAMEGRGSKFEKSRASLLIRKVTGVTAGTGMSSASHTDRIITLSEDDGVASLRIFQFLVDHVSACTFFATSEYWKRYCFT